jgi:hypothetical protein
MGSQSSKSVANITNNLASEITSNCTGEASTDQKVYCLFNIGPGCNNDDFTCKTDNNATFRCDSKNISNIVQSAVGSASASTQAALLSAWNKQNSSATVNDIQDLGDKIQTLCVSNTAVNQVASAEVNCRGATNDTIDVLNSSNVQTQCVLQTIQSLAQTADATASAKATKTGLIAGLVVLLVVIIIAIGLVVYFMKKKKSGGGGASGGKGGIELVGVPVGVPAAAPPAAPAGAGAGAPFAAPAAAPGAGAPLAAEALPAGGRYGWRQERYW